MNTGMIVKSKSTERFTSIDNEIIRNVNLTLEERGLLIFLLSMKHDWVVYKTDLYKRLGCTKGQLDRVFKGLQTKKYILSVKVINELGRFTGWNHVVYDSPANRDENLPSSTNAEVGQSAPISNTNTINSKLNIKKTKFIRPTASELEEYAKEINFFTFDSSSFLDYYDSKGWVVGSTTMKDWKATLRNWQRRYVKFNKDNNVPTNKITTQIKLK
jgi:hypothetical protein